VKSLFLAFFLLLTTPLYALDDFDLAKYGPDAKIAIERKSFIVKIILYNTDIELNRAYEKSTKTKLQNGSGVRGFTNVSKEVDVCYIHLVPPKLWDNREALTIMGHEIYHCTLATHSKVVDSTPDNEETKESINIEDLYDEDRRLELEWLKEEYKDMGIQLDEE